MGFYIFNFCSFLGTEFGRSFGYVGRRCHQIERAQQVKQAAHLSPPLVPTASFAIYHP